MFLFVCWYVCLSVCVSTPRASITSGIIWCDIGHVNPSYKFQDTAVDKLKRRGHSNTVHHARQAKMSKLTQKEAYKLLSGSNKTEHFGYKGEWANA